MSKSGWESNMNENNNRENAITMEMTSIKNVHAFWFVYCVSVYLRICNNKKAINLGMTSAKNLRPISFYLLCIVWQSSKMGNIFLRNWSRLFPLQSQLLCLLTSFISHKKSFYNILNASQLVKRCKLFSRF